MLKCSFSEQQVYTPHFPLVDKNRLTLQRVCILANPGEVKTAKERHSATEISDYVNASVVSSECPVVPLRNPSKITYIAAQSPTASNLCVFWHAIWDANVPLVIMLTR